jgi:hypothetical protein
MLPTLHEKELKALSQKIFQISDHFLKIELWYENNCIG